MLLIPPTHLLDCILLLVAVGRVEFLAKLMSLAWVAHKATKRPVVAAQTQKKRQKNAPHADR